VKKKNSTSNNIHKSKNMTDPATLAQQFNKLKAQLINRTVNSIDKVALRITLMADGEIS
jgi:hypothetical protein